MRVESLQDLSSKALFERLEQTLSSERQRLVEFLRLLAEADRRKEYATWGHSSLYALCIERFHLSEHQAYLRMRTARAGRRYPVVFEMIADGRIHMTAVAKLFEHLTDENHLALLDAAVHQTKEQVLELIALRFPKRDVEESIRRVPEPPRIVDRPAEGVPRDLGTAAPPPAALALLAPRSVVSAPAQMARPPVEPLSSDRFLVRFTASQRCRDLMKKSKDLLSHRSPNADLATIVEAALEVYVDKLERERFKITARPRKNEVESEHEAAPDILSSRGIHPVLGIGRFIPHAVQRAVHERDGGRCTYVGPDGHRCSATSLLELHHIIPVAKGGKGTIDNVTLACRTHNLWFAERDYGQLEMTLLSQGFRSSKRSSRRSTEPEGRQPSLCFACPSPVTGAAL